MIKEIGELDILLDKIPERIVIKGNYYGLNIIKTKNNWNIQYIRIMKEDHAMFSSIHKNLYMGLYLTYCTLVKYKIIKDDFCKCQTNFILDKYACSNCFKLKKVI